MVTRHLNGNGSDNRSRNIAWGTQSDNEMDKARHGTSNRGERQWLSRLTSKQVLTVDAELQHGGNHTHIAMRLGVSRKCISAIANGSSWGWLTGRTNPKRNAT